MRYAANKRLLVAAVAIVFCSLEGKRQGDTCQCARPPGGEIKCPPGHTAFCWIDNNEVHGGCEPTPKDLKGDALKAWVLSKALGRRIVESDLRATTSLDKAFKEGRYNDPNT